MKRTRKNGDITRRRLLDAVVAFANTGRYRVGRDELARFANIDPTAINRHFRAVPLLYRCAARERWEDVALPFSVVLMPDGERKAAVWAILVGEPRQ